MYKVGLKQLWGEDEITNMKANLDATIAELVTPTVQTKQVG